MVAKSKNQKKMPKMESLKSKNRNPNSKQGGVTLP
jgi:hypothetical protein